MNDPDRCTMARARAMGLVVAVGFGLTVSSARTDARDAFLDTSARDLADAMDSVVVLRPQWPPNADRKEEPEASGVVWTTGRHIVTAHHVISKARTVRIETPDGTMLPARMVGFDIATDLAVLQVDQDLRPVVLADIDPDVSERACAAGNAFGLGISLTCGVVSGIHRAGMGFNAIEDFVQTDAAVNPGASGGALLNNSGKLIGILSAIFTKKSDANIGVNFAVSLPLARRVVDDLIDDGRVTRRDPGVRFARENALVKTGPGQLRAPRISGIRPESTAAQAGLAIGDAIVMAGQRRIRKAADFSAAVDLMTGDEPMRLKVLRAGTMLDLVFQPHASQDPAGPALHEPADHDRPEVINQTAPETSGN